MVEAGDLEPVDGELHPVALARDRASSDFVLKVPRFAPVSEAFFGAPDEWDIGGLEDNSAVGVEVGKDLGFEVRAGWGGHIRMDCGLRLEQIFYRCIFCKGLVGFSLCAVCGRMTYERRYLGDGGNLRKG